MLSVRPFAQGDAGDSRVMSLREALQSVEKSGFIEYTLGGHSCSRPAAVQQGHEDDRFDIAPEDGNPLVWRANAIPSKQLKAANVASHFSHSSLSESPLQVATWLVFYFKPVFVIC